MIGFDPVALQNMGSSLVDDSVIVDVDADELRRVASADVRRRCAGLKLASRIVGIATAASAELDDDALLRSIQEVVDRLAALRRAGLSIVAVDNDSPNFPSVFNAITSIMLDVVTEEWKWRRVDPDNTHVLSPAVISKIFNDVINIQPEQFGLNSVDDIDLVTARRLCVMEAIPKLHGLVNIFDYYQKNREKVVYCLLKAVVNEAEMCAETYSPPTNPKVTGLAVFQRIYGICVGLMCEVYKSAAYRDVSRLRGMQELERSIVIAQYERLDGMPYDHVILEYKSAMCRMIDTTNLILGLRQMSQKQ